MYKQVKVPAHEEKGTSGINKSVLHEDNLLLPILRIDFRHSIFVKDVPKVEDVSILSLHCVVLKSEVVGPNLIRYAQPSSFRQR